MLTPYQNLEKNSFNFTEFIRQNSTHHAGRFNKKFNFINFHKIGHLCLQGLTRKMAARSTCVFLTYKDQPPPLFLTVSTSFSFVRLCLPPKDSYHYHSSPCQIELKHFRLEQLIYYHRRQLVLFNSLGTSNRCYSLDDLEFVCILRAAVSF